MLSDKVYQSIIFYGSLISSLMPLRPGSRDDPDTPDMAREEIGRRTPGVEKLLKDFGGRLRALREKRGLSQAELSDMTGVFKGQLLRYEHGRSSPTAEKIVALAKALRVTTDALLRGDRKGEETLDFDVRLFERFRSLHDLPKADQDVVIEVADAVIARHRIEGVVLQRRRAVDAG